MKRKSNPLIKVDEIPKGTLSLQTGSTEVPKGMQSYWMEKGILLSKTMPYKQRVLNAPVTSCKVTACLLASQVVLRGWSPYQQRQYHLGVC